MDIYFRTRNYILFLAILICAWHGCFKDELSVSEEQNSFRLIYWRGKLRSQLANGASSYWILHKFNSISMESLAPDFHSASHIYNFIGTVFTLHKPQGGIQWNRLEHWFQNFALEIVFSLGGVICFRNYCDSFD